MSGRLTCCNDDDTVWDEPTVPALDVHEFLHANVSAKARLRRNHTPNQPPVARQMLSNIHQTAQSSHASMVQSFHKPLSLQNLNFLSHNKEHAPWSSGSTNLATTS